MAGWVLTALWLASALPAFGAPAVEARLDTAQVRVGDPLHLELHLRYERGAEPLLPPVPNLLKGFAVRPEAPAPPAPAGAEVEELRRYELRLYEPGTHHIPPLEVAFARAGGDTLKLASAPLVVEVLKVRQAGDEQLRDIKDPVELGEGLPAWAWGLMAALAAIAIAGVIYWWWQGRPQNAAPAAPRPPRDYLAEFSRIAALGLLERGGSKVYYSLLAETLRRFLEDHLGIEAMEQTTAEIAAALRASHWEPELGAQIERFLAAADLVKFARFNPTEEEARQAPEAGKAIVRRALALKPADEAAAGQALERAAVPGA